MIIGITGKSGVGKSTYANKLAKENGFEVISFDEMSHRVMNLTKVQEKLIEIFGEEVIKDSVVDRKYLGDLIFTNRHLYKEMSDIVWKEMKVEIDYDLLTNKNVILDWILLPHSHYWNMCDKKILIVADEEQRKEKVMIRDNISKEYLEKRDSASISYDDIKFDEVIVNEYKQQ